MSKRLHIILLLAWMSVSSLFASPTIQQTPGGTVLTTNVVINGVQYVRLQAHPNDNYYFMGWMDGNLRNPRLVLDSENGIYQATFSKNTTQLYTSYFRKYTDKGGLTTYKWHGLSTTEEAYDFTTTPNGSLTFDGWYINGERQTVSSSQTYYINSDSVFISAVYAETKAYDVSHTAKETLTNGHIYTTEVEGGYVHVLDTGCATGHFYTFTAVAKDGYAFAGWTDADNHLLTLRNPWKMESAVAPTVIYKALFRRCYFHLDSTRYLSDGGQFTVTRADKYDCDQFTLRATPARGYVFKRWSDGTTDNPYTYIAPNRDTMRVQAIFGAAEKTYTISASHTYGTINASNSAWCDPTYTMTAVADPGYEFIGWSDGILRNPRVFHTRGAKDTTLTARFRSTQGNLYPHYKDVAPFISMETLSCAPEFRATLSTSPLYRFVKWSDDGSTNPTRTFSPTEGQIYRFWSGEVFKKYEYLYNLMVTPAQVNSSTTGTIEQSNDLGTCYQEDDSIPQISVHAVAKDGYEFVGWVDDAGHLLTLRNPIYYNSHLDNHTSTTWRAQFRRVPGVYPTFTFTKEDPDLFQGNVVNFVSYDMDITADCDTQFVFSIGNDDDFMFGEWRDTHSTSTTRSLSNVKSGDIYRLQFRPVAHKYAYNHSITSDDASFGTVQITDSALSICDTVFYRLQAVPQPGYYFIGWSDGNTRNPRMLHPLENEINISYIANFSNQAPSIYSVYREGDRGGNINMQTPTACNPQYSYTFDANLGYHFVRWKEDDNTDSSRVENVSHGLTRTAIWSHDKMRFTEDAGTDNPNTTITQLGDLCNPVFLFYARSPQPGYLFTQWDDGSTENPRVVYPVGDQTFMASFSFAGCNSTASYLNQLCGGTITYTTHTTVGAAQSCGCTYTATATPRKGYIFAGWSDNDSLIQTRVFTLDDRVEQSFTALFVSDDRKYLEWTDQALLLSTYAADLRNCNVSCYINREPTAPATFSVSYDAQHPGRFTVPVADIAQHAGDTLKLVFHNPTTDQYVLGTDIIIPVVVADNSAWSELCAASRIPANIGQTGVVVRDGATLTIDNSGIAMGNLDILDNSKVVVNQSINVAGITMRGDALQDQYPQLIPNAYAYVSNANGDTIYYDYTLDHNYYYPLALPNTTLCSDIRTRFDEPASYQAYDYDGATRATGATGWRTYDDTQPGAAFSAGQGYMLYAVARKWHDIRQEAAFMRIPFHYNMNSGELNNKEVAVFEYGTTDAPDNDRNWNLIGNPYLANLSGDFDKEQQVHVGQLVQHMENGHWTGTYDWTGDLRYVTIPKNGFQEYEQVRIKDATLRPFNSYFIQSSGTGTLVFDVSRKAPSAPARVREINKEAYVDIQLSNGTHSDYTGLMVGENFTTAYEMNADLSKMMGGKEPVSVYLLDGTQPMAFLATTHDAARQTIPVGYRSTASQPMTFSLRDPLTAAALFEAVYLTDYERGTTVDLLTEQYRFTPTTSQSDTRFALNAVIRRQPTVTTDVETLTPTLQGQGRMLPGIYDLTGRRIASIDEPCTGIVPGVYIIITENEIRKEVLR